MRVPVLSLLLAAALSSTALADRRSVDDPKASMRPPAANPAQATYDDIKATLGIVPTFFKLFPETSIEGAWQEMKAVQLSPETAVPPRYKELMGLAIAAQIPCHYCTLFHTETSKLNGAGDAQLREAVAVAAFVRHWSTVFNGLQIDRDDFRKEVDQIMAKLKKDSAGASPAEPRQEIALNTPEDAYRDIQNTLGLVPTFVKAFPRNGIVPAWKEAKTLMFNPNTAIPSKYKDLIALSTSSQIPCEYCVYWDTAAARLDGATDQEIAEAVAVSGVVRHWSTVLNGLRVNENEFAQEVKQVIAHAQRSSAPKKETVAAAPRQRGNS